MKRGYFKPNIKDLRVGYECEIRERMGGQGIYALMRGDKVEYYKLYKPIKIGKTYPFPKGEFTMKQFSYCLRNMSNQHPKIEDAIVLLKANKLRTPYLTERQIRKEGWKGPSNTYLFKAGFKLFWYPKDLRLILQIHDQVKFDGKCKCINTFRNIMSLLNIK